MADDKPEEFDEDAFMHSIRRDSQLDFHYPTSADQARTVYDFLILVCVVAFLAGAVAFIWINW